MATRYVYIGEKTELAAKAQVNASYGSMLRGLVAGRGSPVAWLTTVLGAIAGKEAKVDLNSRKTESAAADLLTMLGYDPATHILQASTHPKLALVVRNVRGRPLEALHAKRLAARLRAAAGAKQGVPDAQP